MDEFTITMNLPQLEALGLILKVHRDHCDAMLNGIGQLYTQMKPKELPAVNGAAPPEPAAPEASHG